eukprot:CAMPEP_0118854980 /NCGR_PEP_ID=MMETSP1163-20130328/2977_1 /TAXON_ID=124430 /ORGANISM="Phaeomonas parva, Strain CCMP2877" /LENGTH=242 /DNA_ID=CAMNT_0006787783 /DNA_START=101 /DNA_END=829 /DNA_ORIENTATION=+
MGSDEATAGAAARQSSFKRLLLLTAVAGLGVFIFSSGLGGAPAEAEGARRRRRAGADNEERFGADYCRQAYRSLYETLGDRLCDHGIEPGNGAYCRDPNNYLGADQGLAPALVEFFKAEGAQSVIDFGSGGGWYADYLNQHGVPTRAYDGAVGSSTQNVTDAKKEDVATHRTFMNDYPFANVTRLALTFYHGTASVPPADWVYCIEVAEHVPGEFEDVLVANLVDHARKGLIVTWATPEQPG